MYTTEVNLLLNKKCLCLALAVIIGLSCFLFPNAKANLTVSAADEVVEVSVDDYNMRYSKMMAVSILLYITTQVRIKKSQFPKR